MVSPFKGLKDKKVELKIGEDIIYAKPIVADAEAFMTMKKEMNSDDAKTVSKIIVDMIARANPEEDKDDIASYVATHYGSFIMQIAVVFGFTSQIEVEETKKKSIQVD